MSWKGFQKAVSRFPHQIMSKKDEVTKDPEFLALESRFNETIKMADKLKVEGQTLRDSISALLSHQAEMASYLSMIYSQNLGVEIEEGDVQKRNQTTVVTALQAVNDAEAAMAYCRDEILPELDLIDRDVIRPSVEIQEIIKTIQKTIVKRNHKLLDYDRHRVSLQKLNQKTDRTLNEEKSIFKVQAQLETATQDYDYLNQTLKRELPMFFQLILKLMEPILFSLFELQSKIYGMIYARCYELVQANQNHFITHSMEVEAGYEWRKQERDVQVELQELDLLKSGGKAWLSVSGGLNSSRLTIQQKQSLKQPDTPPPLNYQSKPTYPIESSHDPKPVFQTSPTGFVKPRAPPPPKRIKYVVALYDYDAQAEGDLSFQKDDRIELIQRTTDSNDWWTGKLNGVVGVFPGTYVTEI